MQKVSQRHRLLVANHFGSKVRELRYHLEVIVVGCDQSLTLFANKQTVPIENNQAVIYGFSAFVNVVQSLKDALKTVSAKQLPWSQIVQLRHGAFIRDARNAATHDGNPVVSAWVDGRYFVPAKIVRLDHRGQVIEIPAPTKDIRTLCLEFAEDFCQLLRETLIGLESVEELKGALFNMAEREEAIVESNVMPEFVKEIFENSRQEIETNLREVKHDPVDQAIGYLAELIKYCEMKRDQASLGR